MDNPNPNGGLQFFSTRKFENLVISRVEKYHNPIVTAGESVSPMTNT